MVPKDWRRGGVTTHRPLLTSGHGGPGSHPPPPALGATDRMVIIAAASYWTYRPPSCRAPLFDGVRGGHCGIYWGGVRIYLLTCRWVPHPEDV